MKPVDTFTARAAVLPIDNVDTDQIIPARFLTVTGKDQLGDALFADWRANSAFPLNNQDARGAEILIAGHNFGCGSSREHAVWALQSGGFRAVVSTSFADIFRNNALGNGLLPIQLADDSHAELLMLCSRDPHCAITVSLTKQTITSQSGWRAQFPIDPFAKHCLLNGTDALGHLLSLENEIAAYEAAHAS